MTSSIQGPSTCGTDGVLIGTEELLQQSPNVTQPVNNPIIPVPSVYMDSRGQIHNVLVGQKRINLLYTNAGVMRSGDIHRNTQHDFVFSGKVEVWTLQKDGSTDKRIYGPYEYIHVPPLVPHIFHFLQDTVMAEWWEPEPFQAWFYTPYRQLVEESFVSGGKLVKLTGPTSYGTYLVLAAAFGLVAGIMIGRWRRH